jgi:hypothetical protein
MVVLFSLFVPGDFSSSSGIFCLQVALAKQASQHKKVV